MPLALLALAVGAFGIGTTAERATLRTELAVFGRPEVWLVLAKDSPSRCCPWPWTEDPVVLVLSTERTVQSKRLRLGGGPLAKQR